MHRRDILQYWKVCYPIWRWHDCSTEKYVTQFDGDMIAVLRSMLPNLTVTCIIFLILSGVRQSTWYCGHYSPIVPAPHDKWWWLWCNWWNEDWQRKPQYSEKICPSATLFTTNPTWPHPGSNPGRRGWKPAINRLIMARPRWHVSRKLCISCLCCTTLKKTGK
jgi:hypothetical protein